MLTTMENWLRRLGRILERGALEPRIRLSARIAAWAGSGFFLSAAALRGAPQPLALGLVCALPAKWGAVTALGAAAGYRLFWGSGGNMGILWVGLGWSLSAIAGKTGASGPHPGLYWGLTALIAGLGGLVFPRGTSLSLLLLRMCLAPGAVWLFRRALRDREPLTRWALGGIAVLALARIGQPGYFLAGALFLRAAFPGAVMAGLGLDLARVTELPMTAAACAAWFLGKLPLPRRWITGLLPGAACLGVMGLWGIWTPGPLPGLLLGGAAACFLPPRQEGFHRQGVLGAAQVRLEIAARVLARIQSLLLQTPEPVIDRDALLSRAVSRGCGNCPGRDSCRDRLRLGPEVLEDPLGFSCACPWQIHSELLRARDRQRDLTAHHRQQQECRRALIQQYRFLSVYLQKLSDQLPRRSLPREVRYRLEVSARSRGKEPACGDRCLAFPGTGCRYYVLLCDGMGTGLGAAEEGQSAAAVLQQMLRAGFPPEHAFRCLNSLLVLRGRAGAVTLDLLEVRLDSGRASLYKWGAAPSYLLRAAGAQTIGTAGPPPGLDLQDARETVDRLSLARGETLILVSDGARIGEALGPLGSLSLPPGELAQRLLEDGGNTGGDDATVAVVRLQRRRSST